jgi:hypothetical protein
MPPSKVLGMLTMYMALRKKQVVRIIGDGGGLIILL